MNFRRLIPAFIICMIFPVIAMMNGGGISILWFIPPAILLLLFAFLSIDKFLILTVFLVPLSVQLRFILPETSTDIFLPTELMLFVILVIMILKTIRGEIGKNILRHPVSVIILLMIIWGLITSLTGTMPMVSLKSMAARLWFIAGFYLLAAQIFEDKSRIRTYFVAYIAGMTPVVLYFLAEMMIAGGFNQAAAYASSRPFFNDHTSFGAAVAFCIPLLVFFIFEKDASFSRRMVVLLILLIFSAAFLLSYSRAAWLSLFIAMLFFIVILSRISWKILAPAIAAVVIVTVFSWQPIAMKLRENRQDSSGEVPKHIQSISNITTDASNMERLNRWKSAIRMFRERPLFGWGPATYQFQYAPFQMADEKTIISTIYGERGNAHSEYLGSLAESGIPGAILYLALLAAVFITGLRRYYSQEKQTPRFLLLVLLAGIMTYVVHGALNNFLDTDKISALFWGMTAAIVALDIACKGSAEADQR